MSYGPSLRLMDTFGSTDAKQLREHAQTAWMTVSDHSFAKLSLRAEDSIAAPNLETKQSAGSSKAMSVASGDTLNNKRHDTVCIVNGQKEEDENYELMNGIDEDDAETEDIILFADSITGEERGDVVEEQALGWKREVRSLYAVRQPGAFGAPGELGPFTDQLPLQAKLKQRLVTDEQKTESLDATFALIHRQEVNGSDLKTVSIEVQNPALRAKITEILHGYGTLDLDTPHLVFQPPFLPFLHRWSLLVEAEVQDKEELVKVAAEKQEINRSNEGESSETQMKAHDNRNKNEASAMVGFQQTGADHHDEVLPEVSMLTLLKAILEEELKDFFKALETFRTTGYIDYDNILAIYEPGQIVVRSMNDEISAGIFKVASLSPYSGLILQVDVIDWDGDQTGYRTESWSVRGFNGFLTAKDLTCFPIEAHENKEAIRTRLLTRGKKFADLRGRYLKSYGGRVKINAAEAGQRNRIRWINERIIVDAKAYYLFRDVVYDPYYGPDGHKPVLRALKREDDADRHSAAHEVPVDLANKFPDLSIKDPTMTMIDPNIMVDDPLDVPSSATDAVVLEMKEDELIVTVAKVRGFALESQQWFEFDVTDLHDFEWNEDVFKNLVLDPEEKELLLALIEQHSSNGGETSFDDFIQGKGKSLILLLGGPPGVGKTLTAESVAERLRKPLFRLSAGSLGASATTVEASLGKALSYCAYWNAVLLIDEADVFLEARSSDSILRNEMVSTFLILLEYYQGILVLTSNRTANLDPAFESRIDIMLMYDDLDQVARKTIWINFFDRMPEESVDISDHDLSLLSKRALNGRQIKSAIKTSRSLAENRKEPLQLKHLDLVLQLREKGNKLLHDDVRRGSNLIEISSIVGSRGGIFSLLPATYLFCLGLLLTLACGLFSVQWTAKSIW